MSVEKIKPGKYRAKARIRVNGIIRQRQAVITGTKEEAEALVFRLKEEMKSAGLNGSLKLQARGFRTFNELICFYNERKGYSSMETYFRALKRDLGNVRIKELPLKFDNYLHILKTENCRTGKKRTNSTINHYIECAKMVCNYALKQRLITGINENILSGFEKLHEEGRDRVLSEYEEKRLFNTMSRLNSYLYYPVLFSIKNPIRKGDLQRLKRDNLDMSKPWIHFYPGKTEKRIKRETNLIFIDNEMIQYWNSLPADCPYLFPRIDEKGRWFPLGDFKKHWKRILREAGIKDFRFHDLKHCAISFMLNNGYTERDIKNLGIQYTDVMIDRYYKRDASKVLEKYKKVSENRLNSFAVKTPVKTFYRQAV